MHMFRRLRLISAALYISRYVTVRVYLVDMRVLSPDACGITRTRQRTQTCAECLCICIYIYRYIYIDIYRYI